MAKYKSFCAYWIAFLSRSNFISLSNLIYFHRGRKTGSHARGWSTKFHGDYMEQHHIDSYGSPHYSRCKTVLSNFHLSCHVISVNRYFRETEVANRMQTNSRETSFNISNFFSTTWNASLHLRIKNYSNIHVLLLARLSYFTLTMKFKRRDWRCDRIPREIKEKSICK